MVVLIAGSPFVDPFVRRVGLERAASTSTVAVMSRLLGYLWGRGRAVIIFDHDREHTV